MQPNRRRIAKGAKTEPQWPARLFFGATEIPQLGGPFTQPFGTLIARNYPRCGSKYRPVDPDHLLVPGVSAARSG